MNLQDNKITRFVNARWERYEVNLENIGNVSSEYAMVYRYGNYSLWVGAFLIILYMLFGWPLIGVFGGIAFGMGMATTGMKDLVLKGYLENPTEETP